MAPKVDDQKDQEEKADGQEHPQRLDGRHQGGYRAEEDHKAKDRGPVAEPLSAGSPGQGAFEKNPDGADRQADRQQEGQETGTWHSGGRPDRESAGLNPHEDRPGQDDERADLVCPAHV